MEVVLRNRDFLRAMLRIFLAKREITMQICRERMSVSAHGQNNMYLVMESALFATDIVDAEFTVNTQHLADALAVLDGDLAVGDALELFSDRSRMAIPFVTTVRNEYEEACVPTTKFIVDAETAAVFGWMRGVVTYEIEDGRLFVRRSAGDMAEEIEFLDIGFVARGELKFRCNNSWAEALGDVEEHVENVMFAFNENALCVQFLFRSYPESYLELQVPRSLVD